MSLPLNAELREPLSVGVASSVRAPLVSAPVTRPALSVTVPIVAWLITGNAPMLMASMPLKGVLMPPTRFVAASVIEPETTDVARMAR